MSDDKPKLPFGGGPFQAFALGLAQLWYLNAYRVRGWGRLPLRRGATLAIANHQHDLDTTGVIMRLSVQGPWTRPIFSVASRRLFEPGFMGIRLAWLQPLLRPADWSPLFRILGMLPIENEPRRRPVAAIGNALYVRHGDLAIDDVFEQRAVEGLDLEPGARLRALFMPVRYVRSRDKVVSLSSVREPYRSEMVERLRAQVDEDLARIEDVLRAGGTLYLTPEGRYTQDGKLSRFRMALDRLAGLAKIYVLPTSYDPFIGRRLSLLYRVLPAQDPSDLRSSLCAPRPITASQLLGSWLMRRDGAFREQDALAEIVRALSDLPRDAFVDPELAADPARMVRRALPAMAGFSILAAESGSYKLAAVRRHPQFPLVPDIVAHQSNMFAETVAALKKLAADAPT